MEGEFPLQLFLLRSYFIIVCPYLFYIVPLLIRGIFTGLVPGNGLLIESTYPTGLRLLFIKT